MAGLVVGNQPCGEHTELVVPVQASIVEGQIPGVRSLLRPLGIADEAAAGGDDVAPADVLSSLSSVLEEDDQGDGEEQNDDDTAERGDEGPAARRTGRFRPFAVGCIGMVHGCSGMD
jgi:hypothetical protein